MITKVDMWFHELFVNIANSKINIFLWMLNHVSKYVDFLWKMQALVLHENGKW